MNINNQQGQGIVELVAAVGIIVFALAGIIALTLFNIIGQKVSEDSLIANNLAHEGIEVVRNLRDTDWLADSSLISLSNHSARAVFDRETNEWLLDYGAYTIDSPEVQLYLKNNLYVHDSVGAEQTKFRRLITIDFICLSDGLLKTSGFCTDIDGDGNPDIMAYRVKSWVRWIDRGGKTHNYELTDYLYDWK